MLAFEFIAKPLLFLHLIAATCAIAACIHLSLRAIRLVRNGAHKPQVQTHAAVLLTSYSIVLVLGAMLYPTYRVRVREDFLEKNFPLLHAMFEIKEHFATTGLVAAVGVFLIVRHADWRNAPHRRYLPMWSFLLFVVFTVLAFNTVTGWYIASLRSV